MLSLLVTLVILAIVVWVVLALIRGITTGASPAAWLPTVVIGIAAAFAVILIAQALGIATPSIR